MILLRQRISAHRERTYVENRRTTVEDELEIYDQMAEAAKSGTPYQTVLDPPPGPPAADLPDWQPGQLCPVNWPSHVHPPRGCA